MCRQSKCAANYNQKCAAKQNVPPIKNVPPNKNVPLIKNVLK